MPTSRPPRRLTLPAAIAIALALAAALAACARPSPTPTPSPTATHVPSATPTLTVTASPSPSPSTTPSLTPSPTPTNHAQVALSPTEAAGRVLWLVNPRNKPRIAFRYYAHSRDVFANPDLIRPALAVHSQGSRNRRDDALVIVASVEHTNAFDRGLDPLAYPQVGTVSWAPPRVAVVFDAATGLSVVGGLADPQAFATLAAIPTARVTPIAGPTTTSTSPAGSIPGSATPFGHAVPTTVWPPGLDGRPVNLATLPDSLRGVLAAWPLLPGNQWVYDLSRQYYGVWAGQRITETVTALSVLPGDVLVAELRVAEIAAPQTVAAIASGLLDDDPANHPAQERVSTLWRVIKDGYAYEARDPNLLRSILIRARAVDAAPIATPEWDSGSPQVYLPTIRLPLADRPSVVVDDPAVDGAEETEAVTTLARKFDACYRQLGQVMPYSETSIYRWFCPGVGVVRVDAYVFGLARSFKQLAAYNLVTTVDSIP